MTPKIKGMIFRLIRDVHAVRPSILHGLLMMILDIIRGAHAVCNLSLCGIFLMILDFIRVAHALDFRRQNDLCHIIV